MIRYVLVKTLKTGEWWRRQRVVSYFPHVFIIAAVCGLPEFLEMRIVFMQLLKLWH